MRRSRVTMARVGVLLVWGGYGWAQGYQYERLAPEPSLKTPYNDDSMLVRAGYEQSTAIAWMRAHIDAVLTSNCRLQANDRSGTRARRSTALDCRGRTHYAFLLQTLALNWALVGEPENAV